MRYVAFILSLFIFSLSTLPCTDGQDNGGDIYMEQSESQNHSHDNEGTCPPFCSCLCCGVVVTVVDVEPLCSLIFKPTFVTEFHYSFYYSHHHPSAVWQPPTV